MNLIKRVFLFLATNIAILVLIWILIFILENYFWIKVSPNAKSGIVPLLIFSFIYWFAWAFISLAISRWMAKRAYNIEIIEESMIMNYDEKIQTLFFKTKQFANMKNIVMPEFGIYESEDPNAFATWPTKNKSLVAFSTWIIQKMNIWELEWVLAHEMSHITNGDMVTMTLLQWVINSFVIFLARIIWYFVDKTINKDSEWSWIWYHISVIVFEIILSILASIVVMAYSRKREYSADRDSWFFTPKQNMIDALKKLKTLYPITQSIETDSVSTFKISSKKSFLSLFSSHPDLDDRINKLQNNF